MKSMNHLHGLMPPYTCTRGLSDITKPFRIKPKTLGVKNRRTSTFYRFALTDTDQTKYMYIMKIEKYM